MEERHDLILIGPIRAGKSTQGRLLAEALGVPQVSMDDKCWDYYKEIGFRHGSPECLGPDGMIASRFAVHGIRRLLEDYVGCVFDLGAGHTVYRDEESLREVKRLLAPYPNVILLLPSPDPDECSEALAGRNTENDWLNGFTRSMGYNPNEHFLRHPSNFALAKRVVYTKGKTPLETRDEILEGLEHRPAPSMGGAGGGAASELAGKLEAMLAEAKRGGIRSLVLIAVPPEGEESEC